MALTETLLRKPLFHKKGVEVKTFNSGTMSQGGYPGIIQ
jgi:hypothetical protein